MIGIERLEHDDDDNDDGDDSDSDKEKDGREHKNDSDIDNDMVVRVKVHGHDGLEVDRATTNRWTSPKENIDASGRGPIRKKPSPKFYRRGSSEHMSSSVLNMTPTMSSQQIRLQHNRRRNMLWKWGRK